MIPKKTISPLLGFEKKLTDTRGSRKLSESLDWRELGSTACLDSRPSTLQAGTLEVPCEVGKKTGA